MTNTAVAEEFARKMTLRTEVNKTVLELYGYSEPALDWYGSERDLEEQGFNKAEVDAAMAVLEDRFNRCMGW